MKKIIIFLSIFTFFIFSNEITFSAVEQQLPQKKINLPIAELPETIEEAKRVGIDFLNFLPGEIKKGWNNALLVWSNIYKYSFNLFNGYLKPYIESIWDKNSKNSKDKIKETQKNLKKEVIKEQEEIKETIKEKNGENTKSLWDDIKLKIGIEKTKK